MTLHRIFLCALLGIAVFFTSVTESFAPNGVKEQTVRAATDNADIKLTVPDQLWDCTIGSASAVDEGGIIVNGDVKSNDLVGIPDDPSYDYPYGLVEFILSCFPPETPEVEDPMTVFIDVQFLPDSGPVDLTNYRYRKYGPLPNGMTVIDPPNGELNGVANGSYFAQWYDFMYYGETGAQLMNSNTFRLYFVDGGRGDDIVGIVDRQIVDQGGPVRVPSVPTINEWGMIMFMVLAGLGSLYYLKRKRIRM